MPPLEFITSVLLVMLTVPETLLNWSIAVPLPMLSDAPPVLLKVPPLLLTMAVPPVILLKLPLLVRLTVPSVRLLNVLVCSRLMCAAPTSTVPLLFQVLVSRLPPLWVVVPEVLRAPRPLMKPPLQLNGPWKSRSKAPLVVSVPVVKLTAGRLAPDRNVYAVLKVCVPPPNTSAPAPEKLMPLL